MTSSYQPGPLGQNASQVAAAIAAQVPSLIPAPTVMRLYTQPAVQAGDTLTATTAVEQTFASPGAGCILPANFLTVGTSLHINGYGVYSTPAVNLMTQTARLRLGGVKMVDSSPQLFPISLTTSRYEFFLHLIVRSTGTTGTIEAAGRLVFATSLTTAITVLCGPSGAASETGNPVTIDTTQPLPVTLTCQFGGLGGGNSNSLRELSISALKPSS